MVAELLTQLAKGQGAEAMCNKTRIAISKGSDGEQSRQCRPRCSRTSGLPRRISSAK